jgi:hypothetical protein
LNYPKAERILIELKKEQTDANNSLEKLISTYEIKGQQKSEEINSIINL